MMKLHAVFAGVALAALLLSSCAQQETVGSGLLSVIITESADAPTKASDVTELSYEKAVNNLQIFIFEGETLFLYEKVDSGLGSLPWTKTYPSLKAGRRRNGQPVPSLCTVRDTIWNHRPGP